MEKSKYNVLIKERSEPIANQFDISKSYLNITCRDVAFICVDSFEEDLFERSSTCKSNRSFLFDKEEYIEEYS